MKLGQVNYIGTHRRWAGAYGDGYEIIKNAGFDSTDVSWDDLE